MTWFAQVRHVMARDVRTLRWAFILLGGLLGIITYQMLGSSPTDERFPLLSVLTYCIPPIIVAMAVLEDSPAQPDAFWSVQPLRGSAVAAAKVALLLAICGVAVAASHGVRVIWGLPLDAMSWGGGEAFLRMAARFAVCRSLRGYLLASLLVTAVSFGLVMRVRRGESPSLPDGAVLSAQFAIVATGALVLIARYRRPRADLVGAASAFAVSGLLMALTPGGRAPREPATTNAHLSGTRISVVADRQPACDRTSGWLVVPVEVVAAPGRRIDLLSPTLTVSTTDGTRIENRGSGFKQVMGVWGPLLPLRPNGTPWTIVRGDTAPTRTGIAFPLAPAELDAVCGRVAQLALDLDVKVSEARELLRIPLRGGTTVRAPGVRAMVEAATATPAGVQVSFELASVTGDAERQERLLQPTYALVDDASGEALADGALTSKGLMTSILLPGLRRSSTASTTFYVRPSAGVTSLPEWSSRATLLVAETLTREALRIHREATLPTVGTP